MEPEGSSPCTQQPTAGPYPKSDEFSSHLTNELTNELLSEKLRVAQLAKKVPVFYETRNYITVFTTARHWSLT